MTTAWKLANDARKRIRKARPMTDVSTIVKGAGKKAATIYSTYTSSVKKARENKLVPAEGREQLISEAYDKAVSDLRELEQKVEAAAHVQCVWLEKARDDARPKVSEATRARIEGYYTRLADSSVSLDRLIELADGDATALRCLEDLAPVLAMSARPDDPQAADGFVDLVQHHALDAYGDDYRQANAAIEDAEKAAYFARVGITQARDGINDPDSLPVVPGPSGEIVYNGAADAA